MSGHEFEQTYSVPAVDCYRAAIGTAIGTAKNVSLGCATLYRLPWTTKDSFCRRNDPHYYPDVICPVRFLHQSRAYILTGLTDTNYRSTEWSYPGIDHNTTDANNWPFAKRRDDIFRVFSSAETCYNKGVEQTNECLENFLRTERTLGTAYCWGSSCSPDGEPFWFQSAGLDVFLRICSIFSGAVFVILCANAYCWLRTECCARRRSSSITSVNPPTVVTDDYQAIPHT